MIGSSKNDIWNSPRKCFAHKKNPGLGANRPSNNWALEVLLKMQYVWSPIGGAMYSLLKNNNFASHQHDTDGTPPPVTLLSCSSPLVLMNYVHFLYAVSTLPNLCLFNSFETTHLFIKQRVKWCIFLLVKRWDICGRYISHQKGIWPNEDKAMLT